jgi:hypothetical protein
MGSWDRWSISRAASPDPGPAGWVFLGLFRRAVDARLSPLVPLAGFEATRGETRRKNDQRKTLAQIEEEIEACKGKAGIAIRHYDGLTPQIPAWPAEALTLFHRPAETRNEQGWLAGDHPIDDIWQMPVAWVVTRNGAFFSTVAYVDRRLIGLSEREGHFVALTQFQFANKYPQAAPEMHSVITELAFELTGRYLFAVLDRSAVFRLDLERNAMDEIYNDPAFPLGLRVRDANHVVGFHCDALSWIEGDDGKWAVTARKKIPRAETDAYCGPLDTEFTFSSSRGVAAFARKGDKIIDVWKVSNPFHKATFENQRVFLHSSWVDKFPAVELLQFAELVKAKRGE